VQRFASRLRAGGLRKHDRVAVLCPNTPPLLEASFAVPAAGGILVALNTRLAPSEIGYIVEHSGARVLFVDAALAALVAPLDLAGVEIVRIADTGGSGDPYEDYLADGSPAPLESWLEDEEEPLSINYTSGTTGRPKGVLFSHRGAYLNALGEVIEAGLGFDSVYLL